MRQLLTVLSLLLVITACKNDPGVNPIEHQRFSYDDQGKKIFLTETTSKITVTFPISTTLQEKQNILSQYSYLNPAEYSGSNALLPENFSVVSFKAPQSYQTAIDRITEIKKNPGVSSANLMFQIGQGQQGIVGLFVVRLKTGTTKQDVDNLVARTKTVILSQPDSDNVQYIFADKNSAGDALDMANYFFESGKFEWCEPDFVLINVISLD